MKKTINIGLLGAGTVGSGVISVLAMNKQQIIERSGADIIVKKVLVRDKNKPRPELKGLAVTDDINEILGDESIDIVVELMGGLHPAREYMLSAMQAGKSVVTANKDVVAQFGRDMFAAAEKANVDFLFEASVGGGIPIITPLKECLTANRLTEVMGIVNGTTNYMLTKMSEGGVSYDVALREAQEKGYAEADPTADVAGLDAAREAAILASIAFNTRVQFDDVSVEGITGITAEDMTYARDLGYVIKLLAIGKDSADKGVDVRVHPASLPKEHPLAAVRGVSNAVFVRGNAIGEAMFYGPGAGSLPTASAVVADIIAEARNLMLGNTGRMRCTCYEHKPLCPLSETTSSYYLRLLVDDRIGALGQIATAFGKADVSLKSVMQTRMATDSLAEIVAITHTVSHELVLQAVDLLKKVPVVHEVQGMIRVIDK